MTRKSAEATASVEQVSELTPFELSRVYAKGWLAGMSCETGGSARTIHAQAEALNPYKVPIERSRWMQGFAGAVRRKFGITPGEENGSADAPG